MRSKGLKVLQLKPFQTLPWLVHGFSTRSGGTSLTREEAVLNLGYMDWDERRNVLLNRKRFQSALDASEFRLIPLKQIHSDLMYAVSSGAAEACPG